MNYDEQSEGPDLDAADLGSMGVLSVGDLLGTSLRAVASNAPALFFIALVLVLPFSAMEFFFDNPIFGLISIMGSFLMQAVVVFAAVQHMAGREVSIGDAVSKGLSKFVPVLIASILVGILVVIGLMLCVVPGVIVQLFFFLTIPAIVAEDLGPIEGMRRSAQLTEGNKLVLFGGLFVFWLLSGVGVAITFAVAYYAESAAAAAIAGAVLDIVATMVLAVYSAVAYARVRGIREGMDVNKLVDVFA